MASKTDHAAIADDFVRRLAAVCGVNNPSPYPKIEPFVIEARSMERNTKIATAHRLLRVNIKSNRWWEKSIQQMEIENYHVFAIHASMIAKILDVLFRKQLDLTTNEVSRLLDDAACLDPVSPYYIERTRPLVRYVEKHWTRLSGDDGVHAQLALLAENTRGFSNTPSIKYALRIEQLIGQHAGQVINPGEAWSDRALADLEAMPEPVRARWVALVQHCHGATGGRPTGKWLKRADELVEPIGHDALRDRLLAWFPLVDRPRTAPAPRPAWHDEPVAAELIIELHADILKGFCWVSAMREDAGMARALGELARSCYRKLPGIGPRAVKIGNAAVYALGAMPGRSSLSTLSLLSIRVKFNTARKLLDRALDTVADREGLPREEIEEMAVPAYGLGEVGRAEEPVGEFRASIEVGGTAGTAAAKLSWIGAQGKRYKSVPAAVKRDHADELKDLKAAVKDIQKMLPAQRDRIDSLFLDRRSWALPTWRERYLDHPLVGTIARRLIWLFSGGGSTTAAVWLRDDPDAPAHSPGRLVRVDGGVFEPGDSSTTVSLWHPIDGGAESGGAETRGDVLAWRSFIEEHRIAQPFKQAHREVYLLTEAERATRVYSNRFAAHILRQHQFHALALQRSWRNKLRLSVDAEFPPAYRLLSAWGLRAEFWVEGIGDDDGEYLLDSGAYRYLATDQVRFYRIDAAVNRAHAGGSRYEQHPGSGDPGEPVGIDRVPPIVLSEILRDVDLFVGVSSVGNNPQWQDGGPEGAFRDYWNSFSFGELSGTAKTRRDFLERLLPRLAIRSACTVTDRFLVVLGRKRTYKIHLGSGNILMEPNNQYLCIVPDSRMEAGPLDNRLFLPFEGDRTLAIILSKAFLLAEDDKITDPTILFQIESSQ